MDEIWKDIRCYEGLYQVSNFGRVKSLKRNMVLVNCKGTCGYEMVTLYANKKPWKTLVHRLVAKAFVDNPLNKEQVNHIVGNKMNNASSNLEWVTSSENVRHAYRTGIKRPTQKVRETAQKVHGIPVNILDKRTGEERSFPSVQSAAYYFNVSPNRFHRLLKSNGESSDFHIERKMLRGMCNATKN